VCVQSAEEAERKAAAARQSLPTDKATLNEVRKCNLCQIEKGYSDYNRNQWNKGEGKSKCRVCVEKALAEESSQQATAKEQKLQEARAKVAAANKSGDKPTILKVESELAALEAELVTGLKPVRMSGRGGGRGRSRNVGQRRGRR